MNKIEEYVRKHAQTQEIVQRGNFFYVAVFVAAKDGTVLTGHGFSKYNPNDTQHGMPFSITRGWIIAEGRAMKDLIAQAVAKAVKA
jgi:hypothetical protein